MNKLTLNELFSGIGAQRKALIRIGVPFEVVGISEIDKFAIKSYESIYGKTYNYGDIRTIKKLNYADFWTYSFPCTDISVAGKRAGINKNTRSGLLYEVQRLLEISKQHSELPKYLMLENVKNLVGKKFKADFDNWITYLDNLGYSTYWKVLNAKDFGIPQNRERVYAISIRKDLSYKFNFPTGKSLFTSLIDILEKEVDETFYLQPKTVEYFIRNSISNEIKGNGFRFSPFKPDDKEYVKTITTKPASRMEGNFIIAASRGRNPNNPSDRSKGCTTKQRLELNSNGVSNTITTVQKDNYVVEKKIINLGNLYPNGSFGGNPQQGRIYSLTGLSPTITVSHSSWPKIYQSYNIRKLTPLECWRLMGFDDSDFWSAKNSGVSNTQLYKQAGNSIVVNVLEEIFKNLFVNSQYEKNE